jgi:hypothetical protein
MTVEETLSTYIDPRKVVYVSLATDGLTPSVDNILQISMKREDANPPSKVFVAGGDAVSTYEYTHIPADFYRFSAESPTRAWAQLREFMGPTAVIAMYNSCGFGQPFLECLKAKAGGDGDYRYIDVLLLAKAARNRNCIGMMPPRTLEELHYAIQKKPASKSYSYKLPDMCAWLKIQGPEGQMLTADLNLMLLRELYIRILPLSIG